MMKTLYLFIFMLCFALVIDDAKSTERYQYSYTVSLKANAQEEPQKNKMVKRVQYLYKEMAEISPEVTGEWDKYCGMKKEVYDITKKEHALIDYKKCLKRKDWYYFNYY